MIIKLTGKYKNKAFIVKEYCCEKMEDELSECTLWSINNEDEIVCNNDYWMFTAKFCSHCGEKITIQ